MTVVVELLVCVADGELDFGHARAHRAEHLAQLGGSPHTAERPGARADHGDGLVAEDVRRDGARSPVERVLERARDRRVVLGCGEEDARRPRARARGAPRRSAGPGTTSSSASYGGISFSPFQSSTSTPSGASSRRARRRPVLFEPARSEPLIARTALLRLSAPTSVRSAFSVTSLPRAGSPFGSGMFQLMSNCGAVDGRLELEAEPRRAEVVDCGPVDVPGRALRACVMPLMRDFSVERRPGRRRA